MNNPYEPFTKEKAIKRILIIILSTVTVTVFILLFANRGFPIKPFLIAIGIMVPIMIISAIIGYKHRQQILKSSIKINYKNHRVDYWPRALYWPLTKEQFLKWEKPANTLLRIKFMCIVLFGFVAYSYFYLGKLNNYVLGSFVGGMGGVIFGIFYYYAVKSGKIKYE